MTSLQGNLEGVILLTRHGDRTRFYQNPEDGYKGTNTHITPLGEAQTYSTGQYIRSRYIDPSSSSQISGISVDTIDLDQLTVTCDAATESNVIVLSAYSMWQGIYPASPYQNVTLSNGTVVISPLGGQQYVPMETVEFEQSPLLEAFNSCPAYTANLNRFYNSSEYAAKSELEKPYRASLAGLVDGRNTTLKDAYNVYDFINIGQIYNATFKASLDNSTLAKASDVANWLSYRVFTGPTLSSIGNVAGRGMMSQIIEAMNDIADTTTPRKIKHYSLSYKPFLSLFNMTGIAADHPELQAVPAYSSMMALELRNISSELYVNLVFRNGSDAGAVVQPYAILGASQVKMSSFIQTFNSSAIHNTLEWCKVCNQTSSINGCDELLFADRNQTTPGGLLANNQKNMASTGFSPVGAGFIGAVLALFLAAVVLLGHRLWLQKRPFKHGKRASSTFSPSSPVQLQSYTVRPNKGDSHFSASYK